MAGSIFHVTKLTGIRERAGVGDDERRKLADNMRVFDVVEDGRGRYWLNGTLFGMDVSARSEEGLRNGMVRLASFIDPDCEEGRYSVARTVRPVDRKALLALAEEMQGYADGAASGDGFPYVNAGYLWSCADRIREALGVVS